MGTNCRLEDKGVHADGEFKQILKHRLFADAHEDENASLNHLISVYVERQFTLYKARFSSIHICWYSTANTRRSMDGFVCSTLIAWESRERRF